MGMCPGQQSTVFFAELNCSSFHARVTDSLVYIESLLCIWLWGQSDEVHRQGLSLKDLLESTYSFQVSTKLLLFRWKLFILGRYFPLGLYSEPHLNKCSGSTYFFLACQNEILIVGPINPDAASLFFITKVTLLGIYICHANWNNTIKGILGIRCCADSVLFFNIWG